MTGHATSASRQKLVGAAARRETQKRLLEAAAREFEANGFTAATVSRIASRAGVTVQTLYLAWGSKRALLRAYMESTLASELGKPGDFVSTLGNLTPDELVARISTVFVATAGASGVVWKVYRDAAAVDPEIASDWAELQSLRRTTFASIINLIPHCSLRHGLDAASATDTAWVIASPETFDLLVRHQGYTPDRYRDWVHRLLIESLLASPPLGQHSTP